MKSLLILIITGICSFAFAQVGSPFPYLEGENLIHGSINLPDQAKGKYTLIGIALSKDSEESLKRWFDPVYQQLIKKPDPNSLFAVSYDINVYFIPMLTGAKRPAYEAVMKKVEKEVDKQLHGNILFYKGTLKEYKDALKIDDKEVPYFYLLDDTGKIIYMTQGFYSDAQASKDNRSASVLSMGKGPIGIFDSGYGGLTVLSEITKTLPQYDYIYLGDNARTPYGTRSFETIYSYTLECVKYLFKQGCPLVILACNTASAKALRNIQQLDLPKIAPDKRGTGSDQAYCRNDRHTFKLQADRNTWGLRAQ